MSGADEIRWNKRVTKERIRRLYESEARGLLDTELLEDVGTRLCLRCRDILTVTEAKAGRVACPRCAKEEVHTVISRPERRKPVENPIICPRCGWETTWLEYKRTFLRRQMNDGGAGPEFKAFIERYNASTTPSEKMIAIDGLIHAFHVYLLKHVQTEETRWKPCRAAAVNLIEGKLADVVEFLDRLAYGPSGNPRLVKIREEWRKSLKEQQALNWKEWKFPGREKS